MYVQDKKSSTFELHNLVMQTKLHGAEGHDRGRHSGFCIGTYFVIFVLILINICTSKVCDGTRGKALGFVESCMCIEFLYTRFATTSFKCIPWSAPRHDVCPLWREGLRFLTHPIVGGMALWMASFDPPVDPFLPFSIWFVVSFIRSLFGFTCVSFLLSGRTSTGS